MATETTTIRVVADTSDAERALGRLTSALTTLAGISLGAGLVKQIVEITSNMQEMTNKLIFATGNIEMANGAMGILAETAMRTGSNLGGTVDLFQKLAQSATFSGSSTQALATIVENFNKTLQISGASGAGAASALYQFAQAMQKGTLNGDEFRTIQETNGFLLKVLQQETGKSATELRQMAEQGRLSAELIGRALTNSDIIAQAYGNTIRTIPQAFENLKTQIGMTIKALDDASGASAGLVKILTLLANNIDIVIAVAAGLFAAFAVGRIIAIAGAIMEIVAALRAMTIMEAIASGGLSLAVGAAAGLAAYEATNIALDKSKSAMDDLKKKQEELNAGANKGLVITHQRTQQALDLDKTLKQHIASLAAANALDAQAGPIKSRSLEVEKAVTAEKIKYLQTGEAMLPALERSLRTELLRKAALEDQLTTAKLLFDLETQRAQANITDAFESKVAADLANYRKSVTQEEFATKKNIVEQAIRETTLSQYNNDLKRTGLDLDAKKIAYAIQDVAARDTALKLQEMVTQKGQAWVDANRSALIAQIESNRQMQMLASLSDEIRNKIADLAAQQGLTTEQAKIEMAVRDKIRQYGSDFTTSMQEAYRTQLQQIAASEKQLQLETAIRDMKAPPTTQDIIGAMGQQFGTTESGIVKSRQTQEQALQQLRDAGLVNETEYQNRLLIIQQNAAQQRLTQQQAESAAVLKNAGVTNQAVIDMVTKQQEQVAMIRQGGIVGLQGMLGATANIFQQLGTYNKSAFETYKALAIAQAMISTYQAAAMAIAMPPGPPLSYIYVASAIAAGLAQVAAIRNQQFSGRMTGGPVVGGQTYLVGEKGPELFTPGTAGGITPNNQMSGGTTVNFNITTTDAGSFDRLLLQRRALITGIIADAQLEKGKRA